MKLSESAPRNGTSCAKVESDYFIIGFFIDVNAWAGALVEHVDSQNKLILHDVEMSFSFASASFEAIVDRFVGIVNDFKSTYKAIYVNNCEYKFLFEKKYYQVKVVDGFDPATAPVKLKNNLEDGVLAVTQGIEKILAEDFKSFADPAAINHRIFAACIASKKPKRLIFTSIKVPGY